MPYITNEAKLRLSRDGRPESTGELNYLITCAMIDFISERMARGEKVGYDLISRAISAATEAGAEMRRRLLAGYEDGKVVENGDVYPKWLTDAVNASRSAPDHEPYWADRREFWGVNADKALDFRAREREEMRKYEETAAAALVDPRPVVQCCDGGPMLASCLQYCFTAKLPK